MPLSSKKKNMITKMIMKNDYHKTRFFYCTYNNEQAKKEGRDIAEDEFHPLNLPEDQMYVTIKKLQHRFKTSHQATFQMGNRVFELWRSMIDRLMTQQTNVKLQKSTLV
jgi:hypothetical protein